MKIIFFGYRISLLTGHARPAFFLARELKKKGHEATIVTGYASKKPLRRDEERIKAEEFGEVPIIRPFSFPSEFLRPTPKLKTDFFRLLKDVDVIHAFDLTSLYFLSRMFEHRLPHPTIFTLASYPKLQLSEFLRLPLSSKLRILKTPVYLQAVFTPDWVVRNLFKIPDGIVATSRGLAEQVRLLGGQVKDTVTIPPPVAIQEQIDRHKTTLFTYLYFGWASQIRGMMDVVEAFARVRSEDPPVQLVLAPREVKGVEEEWLLSRVRKFQQKLPKGAIRIEGFRADIATLFSRADAVVLPFRSAFGYSQPSAALLEAMAAQKPIITTPVGAVTEIVEDRKTSLLVSPGNIGQLAEAMSYLKKNVAFGRRLGENARAKILSDNDPRRIAQKTLDFYRLVGKAWEEKQQKTGWAKYSSKESYGKGKNGEDYERRRFSSFTGRLFDRREKELLLTAVSKDKKVKILEVGTGTGRFALHLAEQGYQVLATDVLGPLMETAKRKVKDRGLQRKIKFQEADVFKLPFPDGSFDFVFAIRVANQFYNNFYKREAIVAMVRVLRPGGGMFFDVVNRQSLASLKNWRAHITIGQVKEILESEGLKIVWIRGRMTSSQTLLEILPLPLAAIVDRLDTALSDHFPYLATRVYFLARKPSRIRRQT